MLNKTIAEITNRTLQLEYEQASHLRSVLAEAQAELNRAVPKLAGSGTLQASHLMAIQAQVNATMEAVTARLASGLAIASSLQQGLDDGQAMVAQSSGIPTDSAYWMFSPTLNLDVLTQARANGISLIRNVTDELKSKLLLQVQVGYSQGEGIGQIMRRMTGKGLGDLTGRDGQFRTAKFRAEMIGRTTVNELVNKAGLESFKQLNDEFPELELEKQWITTSDKRTSPRCISLSGQKRKLTEAFVAADGWSGQTSPAHVMCRSRVVPLAARYKKDTEKKWRDRFTKAQPNSDREKQQQEYLRNQARAEKQKLPKTLKQLSDPLPSLPLNAAQARSQAIAELLGADATADDLARLIYSDPLKFDKVIARQYQLQQKTLDSLTNPAFAKELLNDSASDRRDFMSNTLLTFDAPEKLIIKEDTAFYRNSEEKVSFNPKHDTPGVRLHEYGHYLDHQLWKADPDVGWDTDKDYFSYHRHQFSSQFRNAASGLTKADEQLATDIHLEMSTGIGIKRNSDRTFDAREFTNLMDLYGSITLNRVGFGHSAQYYADSPQRQATEAFANSTQIYSTNNPVVNEILDATPLAREYVDMVARDIRLAQFAGNAKPIGYSVPFDIDFNDDPTLDFDNDIDWS